MEVIGRKIEIDGVGVAIDNQKQLKDAIKLTNKALDDIDYADENYQKFNRTLAKLKAVQKENRRENLSLQKTMVATGEVSTGAYRKLSLELNTVKARYKDLAAENKGQTQQAKDLLNQISSLDTKLKGIDKTVGESYRNVGNYQSAFGGVANTIKGFVGAYVGVQAVKSVVENLIIDSVRLAKEAKGVEFAFEGVAGGAAALIDTRNATRGLISDLEIKRSIVEFDNFNISQKETATLFEFLAVRATQTGQSVDKLKSSLVEGLSKESKLRIDNLGISTAQLNEELERTPDFVQAVANIAKREIAEAGNILDDASNATDRWNASMENLKVSIGQGIDNGGFLSGLIDVGTNIINRFSEVNKVFGFSTGLGAALFGSKDDATIVVAEYINGLENTLKAYEKTTRSLQSRSLQKEYVNALVETGKFTVDEAIKRSEKILDNAIANNKKALAKIESDKLQSQIETNNKRIEENQKYLDKEEDQFKKQLESIAKDLENSPIDLTFNIADKAILEYEKILAYAKEYGLDSSGFIDPNTSGNGLTTAENLYGKPEPSNPLEQLPDNSFGGGEGEFGGGLEEITNREKEELEKRAANYQQFALAAGDALSGLFSTQEEEREQALRNLGKFLIASIEKTLLASIAEIYLKNVSTLGFLGIAKGAALTVLVKGAASIAQNALSAEKGIAIDHNGKIQGKRHYDGGVGVNINGRSLEVERGENIDVDEFGNTMIINRLSSLHEAPLLKAMKGKQFAGKGALLSSINQKFGGLQLAKDGIAISSSANNGIRQSIENDLNKQSSKDIAQEVYRAALAGTMQGSKAGITEANEYNRKISELDSKRSQ